MKTSEVPIESPCHADWTTMNPRQTGRFCGDCKKVVHDLSSMREADAKRRVAAAPEGLCIRYLHDEHGNIWFADTPLVSPRSLVRRGAALAAAALMPVLSACMGSAPLELPQAQPVPTEPTTPDVPPDADADAGSDARITADPAIGIDAGTDGEADAEPDPGSDAAAP